MTVAFENCQLDPDSRELYRDGAPVPVEPKTFDLLVYLINNRERAIGKDELQDNVWGTIVSDAALTRAVMKARKAVGDDTKNAAIIKTVPRFGYKFVANIKFGSTPAEPSSPERHSIAVLPLENMSGDPENEYFSDGIAEEILNLLAKLPALRVASRTSSFAFRNSDKTLREIAQTLDVQIVLEGSVRKAGNRVRITTQLVDAKDDAHLWSEIYDRELTDIFAVQAEIAREVVAAMTRGEAGAIHTYEATDSPKAYDFYLRGRQLFHEYDCGCQQQASEMFRRAIEVDPDYAKAWAGLANSTSLRFMWWEASDANLQLADEASNRSLDLAPDLAEAHTARAFALTLHKAFDEAEQAFERALELDPLLWESWYLYGRACYASGQLERAAENFLQAAEVRPDDYQALSLAASCHEMLDNKEKAIEISIEQVRRAKAHLELHPGDTRCLTLGAGNLQLLGDFEGGEKWIQKALTLAPDDIAVLHNAGCYYAANGHVDKALDIFERRFELGDAYLDWIDNDSDFDSIRDHPRFKAMIARQLQNTASP